MPSRELLNPASVSIALEGLPGWSADGNSTIHKTFMFGNHIEAMGFVVRVALEAEKMDHHPDLRIVYNRVEINLNTHDAGGVTAFDMELATKIEANSMGAK